MLDGGGVFFLIVGASIGVVLPGNIGGIAAVDGNNSLKFRGIIYRYMVVGNLYLPIFIFRKNVAIVDITAAINGNSFLKNRGIIYRYMVVSNICLPIIPLERSLSLI